MDNDPPGVGVKVMGPKGGNALGSTFAMWASASTGLAASLHAISSGERWQGGG
jgi:hypothetical protein